MSKIEIKDLYLVFGNEKQKALKMLKEGKRTGENYRIAVQSDRVYGCGERCESFH